MEDRHILRLYISRDEAALSATAEKYGNYCRSIAHHILGNAEDAEECVNDAWLGAWNTIPPKQPENLATYLGKLTRNASKLSTSAEGSATDRAEKANKASRLVLSQYSKHRA